MKPVMGTVDHPLPPLPTPTKNGRFRINRKRPSIYNCYNATLCGTASCTCCLPAVATAVSTPIATAAIATATIATTIFSRTGFVDPQVTLVNYFTV